MLVDSDRKIACRIESILDPHYWTLNQIKTSPLCTHIDKKRRLTNRTQPSPLDSKIQYNRRMHLSMLQIKSDDFTSKFKLSNGTLFQIYQVYSVQSILWTQHKKLRKQEGDTTPSVLILFSIQACFSAQGLQKSRIQQDERKLKTTQVTGGQGTVQKIELLPHVWYITSLQGQKELVGGWNVWHFFFLLHPTCQLTVYHED